MRRTLACVPQQLDVGLRDPNVLVSEQLLDPLYRNPRLVEQRRGCGPNRVRRVAATLLGGASGNSSSIIAPGTRSRKLTTPFSTGC